MSGDMTQFLHFGKLWKLQMAEIMNYWTYNVPISGFSVHDNRLVRVTNNRFEVQTESKIGAPFETFSVKSFDKYCKHVFEHFPFFDNKDFIWTMSNFWKQKYLKL